jgi:hypothetical protein
MQFYVLCVFVYCGSARSNSTTGAVVNSFNCASVLVISLYKFDHPHQKIYIICTWIFLVAVPY